MKAEKKKSSILRGVVIGGMIAGALPMAVNANNLLNYEVMGSGSELRSELLEQYGSPIDAVGSINRDYIIGEAKCGEGKCGKDEKKETTKEVKEGDKKVTTETKTSEATCGEKTKTKADTKKDSKDKTTEAKCGENTCGGK